MREAATLLARSDRSISATIPLSSRTRFIGKLAKPERRARPDPKSLTQTSTPSSRRRSSSATTHLSQPDAVDSLSSISTPQGGGPARVECGPQTFDEVEPLELAGGNRKAKAVVETGGAPAFQRRGHGIERPLAKTDRQSGFLKNGLMIGEEPAAARAVPADLGLGGGDRAGPEAEAGLENQLELMPFDGPADRGLESASLLGGPGEARFVAAQARAARRLGVVHGDVRRLHQPREVGTVLRG